MRAFLTSPMLIILILLILCFVHFLDALSGHDWHLFVWASLVFILAVVFIILLLGGS